MKTDYHASSGKFGRVCFVLLTTSENKLKKKKKVRKKKNEVIPLSLKLVSLSVSNRIK